MVQMSFNPAGRLNRLGQGWPGLQLLAIFWYPRNWYESEGINLRPKIIISIRFDDMNHVIIGAICSGYL